MIHFLHTALSALLVGPSTVAPGLAEVRQEQAPQVLTDSRPVVRRPIPSGARAGAQRFARTELYFGTAKPDGVVTEAEFRRFIDRQVTPKFPDGLTILTADGQFRSPDGTVVKEQSFV